MSPFIRKLLVCTTAFFLISGFSVGVYSSHNYDEESMETKEVDVAASVSVVAKSGILMEQSTGKILYEVNSSERIPPASITKVMTMLLVMEALENGSIKLTDSVAASAHACSMGGSQIWLKENEIMTVDELLKATAIASANDAAMALAELVGGSEEGFVAMMNNKAVELGMEDTSFINPTGLDAKGHLSSAKDVAIMSRALLFHEKITEYTTVWMDSLRGGKTELVNTNKLVRFYKGCNGLKTGTTDGAGSCVSVSAKRDEMGLISVVMGSNTSKERFDSARSMLDFGFSTFTIYKAEVVAEELSPVAVVDGVVSELTLLVPEAISIVMEKGNVKGVTKSIVLPESIEAPVQAGQNIGEVIFTAGDGELEILKMPIKAANGIEKMTLLKAFSGILKLLVAI